ncbi:MAG: hypothetical protein ACK52I_26225 [Pseudomonadota bacterium]
MFKVGDRVKCVKEYPQWLTLGKEYIVTDVFDTPTICVRGDGGDTGGFDPEHFELAESEPEQPKQEPQQPEIFEHKGRKYRYATEADVGKNAWFDDRPVSEVGVEKYVYDNGNALEAAIARFRKSRVIDARHEYDWNYAIVDCTDERPAEPTIQERVTLKIERSSLIYNYLDAQAAFERASTAYNEACQAIRDKLKEGEKFVYMRYGQGYIVQRDKDGFTVDPIDMV